METIQDIHPEAFQSVADDLLETAWGIICNAGEGDWDKEHPTWKEAAEKFRTKYFAYMKLRLEQS